MTDRGWFPVFRKIFESDVWDNEAAFRLWVFILGNVAHNESKVGAAYQCVTLQPGQMLTGRKKLAEKCGLTEMKVRSALKYLKITNRIRIETTNRFSVITVINWRTYRDVQLQNNQRNIPDDNQQITNKQPADNHIQEVKKLRSEKGTSKQQHHLLSPDDAFSSSLANAEGKDNGNGLRKGAGKGSHPIADPRPYLDPIEYPSVQRDVLDRWEESFGRISKKVKLETAKIITAIRRDERYIEDNFFTVVDHYASAKPKPVMSPLEFFRRFDEMAEWAGVEPYE